jgi:cellulase
MSRSVLAGSIVALMASTVSAHGHVQKVIADGVEYTGSIPSQWPADMVGWKAQNTDNGFVEPASFGSADIVCHKGATAPDNYATVQAGSSVTVQWDTWPESHKGPVIDYLASCGSDCASADKSSLSFAKIQEKGFEGGVWAADELISNGNSWTIPIPSSVAPGKYVLRHEIIALHSGGQANGAQAYPQCINIEVTGGGSSTPSGTSGTSLYTATDPGILFDIYTPFDSYPIPGPSM